MFLTGGATGVTFVSGALAFWSPIYIYKSALAGHQQANDAQ